MKAKFTLRQAVDSLYHKGPTSHDSYTRLALQCFQATDLEQAKRLESHMDLHLYHPPDTFLHNRLLHVYGKSGKVAYARNLFDKMPHRDIFSWNALLSVYNKSGSVEDLKAVFDDMPYRDSVSYNTVISGFAGKGCGNQALNAFVTMQKEGFVATKYTYVSVLNACTQMCDMKRGKQIHGRIVTGNLGGNAFIWNALTDLYAKCGEIDQARWLFDGMVSKNVVSWNSMISGYLKNGKPEKCIELFHDMQASSLKPDQVTVSNVLNAYIQSGRMDEANRIFSGIRGKDEICWTVMIVGYAQSGREAEALKVFCEMLSENIKPDSYTISSVVSCCAKLASLSHGQAVHGMALLMGLDNNLLVSSALVDMYGKCGVVKDAWLVFSKMSTRNVVSWNAMIIAYAQNGQDLESLSLYEKMLQENMSPDGFTFTGVLSACAHAGLVEEGKKYFDSMSKLYGLTPALDHYALMINLLGRWSGCMDKAMDIINSMPLEPNPLIWSTVLSVSAMKGDIEHGEMAAKHLFELDALNAGPYIMLSNMYAACGRWKDVASMRSLMKTKKIRKFAAYSWVEIDNQVHKFVAGDQTHPDTKIIYEELDRLVRKLEEAGFSPNTGLVLHDVGEKEKFESICYHSEKLALAFGLIKRPHGVTPIRIIKNIRVCGDCHIFMKFVSNITGRHVILRDSTRFHHFVEGKCSCNDNW